MSTIHTHTPTHTHTNTRAHAHITFTRAHKRARMQANIYTRRHTYIHIRTRAHARIDAHKSTHIQTHRSRARAHTHSHTHAHAHTHTHTHTHTTHTCNRIPQATFNALSCLICVKDIAMELDLDPTELDIAGEVLQTLQQLGFLHQRQEEIRLGAPLGLR